MKVGSEVPSWQKPRQFWSHTKGRFIHLLKTFRMCLKHVFWNLRKYIWNVASQIISIIIINSSKKSTERTAFYQTLQRRKSMINMVPWAWKWLTSWVRSISMPTSWSPIHAARWILHYHLIKHRYNLCFFFHIYECIYWINYIEAIPNSLTPHRLYWLIYWFNFFRLSSFSVASSQGATVVVAVSAAVTSVVANTNLNHMNTPSAMMSVYISFTFSL